MSWGEPKEGTRTERMWRCPHDGGIYISPRCYMGADLPHEPVTVTTVTTITPGHASDDA